MDRIEQLNRGTPGARWVGYGRGGWAYRIQRGGRGWQAFRSVITNHPSMGPGYLTARTLRELNGLLGA